MLTWLGLVASIDISNGYLDVKVETIYKTLQILLCL